MCKSLNSKAISNIFGKTFVSVKMVLVISFLVSEEKEETKCY